MDDFFPLFLFVFHPSDPNNVQNKIIKCRLLLGNPNDNFYAELVTISIYIDHHFYSTYNHKETPYVFDAKAASISLATKQQFSMTLHHSEN